MASSPQTRIRPVMFVSPRKRNTVAHASFIPRHQLVERPNAGSTWEEKSFLPNSAVSDQHWAAEGNADRTGGCVFLPACRKAMERSSVALESAHVERLNAL